MNKLFYFLNDDLVSLFGHKKYDQGMAITQLKKIFQDDQNYYYYYSLYFFFLKKCFEYIRKNKITCDEPNFIEQLSQEGKYFDRLPLVYSLLEFHEVVTDLAGSSFF